jgi:hypothetical protein
MSVDLNAMPLGQVVTAIGGLGTAAFGVVDASKAVIPGINRIGLKHIQDVVASLTPDQTGEGLPARPVNSLPRKNVLETVEANWINGNDLTSQKAIAKSLIKLHMSPGSAEALAAKTNVDPVVLRSVATKISTGASLVQPETDVYARFDLIVTALLDEAFQRSDQQYRNIARGLAALVAILLAVAAGRSLTGNTFWTSQNFGLSVLVGLLATPLAPVAKDLSSALAAAVNAMQVVKKK